MKTYRATARREDKWWVVQVEDVGATQGRTTAEAYRMARGLVAAMREIPLDEVDVQLDFELPGPLGEEVRLAKKETRDAERAQRKAAERVRSTIAHILGSGMSKRDAARILGVSPQRISQLVRR